MPLKTRVILVLLVGTIMGLGLSLGGGLIAKSTRPLTGDLSWEQARQFAEVMARVKRDYIEPLDDQQLLESAIRGMVAELDRHSEYLDSEEYEDIRISASGSYSGVGIEVSTIDDKLVVVAPFDGTPAQLAGIRSGDEVIAIDNDQVDTENLQNIIGKMRGRAGTHVILTIRREEVEDPIVFNLRREKIQVASVRKELIGPDLAYIRISQFTDTTASEVRQAFVDMAEQQHDTDGDEFDGVVIDLRDNPGGTLDAAVEVSDLFLEAGVIVTADGRTPESRFSHDASRGDILEGKAIVVLVNGGSASASEIVAGALQDHGRATIIGTATFGKGLVQTVMPLSKGRAIKLTTSRYYTPSGDSIHETGIAPDVVVESGGDYPVRSMRVGVDREHDAQLSEAIDVLQNRRVMHSNAM